MAPSNDPRFARLHTDPRFRRPKQKNLKVEIDERFRDVLESEEFGGKGKSGEKGKGKGKGVAVDKRGRPLTSSHHADQLKRFYRLRSASPDRPEDAAATGGFVDYARGEGALPSSGSEDESGDSVEEAESDAEEEVELGAKRKNRLPRFEDLDEDSDEEEEESESEIDESHLEIDLSDDDRDTAQVKGKGKQRQGHGDSNEAEQEDEEGDEQMAEPTTRVAAVNLDWDNLRAVDLFSVFNSFLKPDPSSSGESSAQGLGKLLSVKIYPSSFGKERMALEEREGPGGGIFAKKYTSGKVKGSKGGKVSQSSEDENSEEEEEEGESDAKEADDDDGHELESDEEEDGDDMDSGEEDDFEMNDDEEARSLTQRGRRDPGPKEIDGLEIVSDVSSDDGDSEEGDVNMEQLRQYQLERLRYYYAVATFSTVQAAMKVVSECNGTEFERTANVLDLSYVPEDMEFDEDDLEDEATKELKGYKGNDFITDALRHSKVKLTWDQDDPNRVKVTRRNLTQEELEQDDLNAYIASSGSESEPEDQNGEAATSAGVKEPTRDKASRKDALRGLLLNGDDENGDIWGKAAWGSKYNDVDSDRIGGDMEIKFKPALSGTAKANGADEENMTTLERYQMRMKEKKARKKEKVEMKRAAANDGQGDEPRSKSNGEGDGDDFFGEDSGSEADEPRSRPPQGGKQVKDAAVAEESELEGIEDIAAGGRHVEHFAMKDILKAEKEQTKGKKRKRSKKKSAHGEDERDVELGPEGWSINVKDERFKALHEEPDFAIDPSNPRFQKTKAMQQLLDERNRQRQNSSRQPKPAADKTKNGGSSTRGGNADVEEEGPGSGLGSLVQSVKSKMGQNQSRGRNRKRAKK